MAVIDIENWPTPAADEPQIELVLTDSNNTLYTYPIGCLTLPTPTNDFLVGLWQVAARIVFPSGKRLVGIRLPCTGKFHALALGATVSATSLDRKTAYKLYQSCLKLPQTDWMKKLNMYYIADSKIVANIVDLIQVLTVELFMIGTPFYWNVEIPAEISADFEAV